MKRFVDKVVIVTGSGSGIGRATAIAFAREGAQVVVADISAAGGKKTVESIQSSGGKGHFTLCDTGNVESVNALVSSTVESFGKLDVLFNNAGIFDGFPACVDMTDEVWNRVLGVNLSGYFYCSRAALPHLIKTKGNIIMTASCASYRAMTAGIAYTAAKHGIVGLINQIASEYGPQGVRVNGVAPGAIRTNIAPERSSEPGIEEWVQSVTPLGYWAEPDVVADPVLFLASDAARYITGTVLRVDGGWMSK